MSTMPPISDSRSAPLMLLSSPAVSILASQARRSCLGRSGISFEARAALRESSVDCMRYSISAFSPVMPGLVPGIHVSAAEEDVDGRDRPGHDGVNGSGTDHIT